MIPLAVACHFAGRARAIAHALRRFTFVGPIAAAAACDPAHAIHLALVPPPAAQQHASSDSGLALVARIAARHGLQPVVPQANEFLRWTQCFHRRGIWVCAKAAGSGMEVQLGQRGASRKFGPAAERLRLEVEDSLSARFGRSAIQECDVKPEPDPDAPWWNRTKRAICVPKARTDSSARPPN
jgi:hypothetical protein